MPTLGSYGFQETEYGWRAIPVLARKVLFYQDYFHITYGILLLREYVIWGLQVRSFI